MNTMYASRGVTLVELLIGLAIAAIVLLPLTDMLRAGADSARFVRSGLDQNADARFAMNRIAAQAASVTLPQPGPATAGDAAAWLVPMQYTVQNGALIETDPAAKPVRASTLLTGVRAFQVTVPDVGAGLTMLRIDLVLAVPDCQPSPLQSCTVAYARTVRVGVPP